MKFKIMLLSLMVIPFIAACSNDSNVDYKNPGPLTTWDDSLSYFIGNSIGMQFAQDSLKINYSFFIKAIEDAKKGDTTFISPDKLRLFGMNFQDSMMRKNEAARVKQEEEMQKAAADNIVLSEKFLAENKSKPGIIETESGLQYEVIKEGTGKKPKMDNVVKFHIRAFTADGTKFDDSHDRGQPIEIPVKGQVPGWIEAFTNMKEGAIWKVYVPPALGWGEKGIPDRIPPNSVTVFELELLEVLPPLPEGGQPGMAPQIQAQPVQPAGQPR